MGRVLVDLGEIRRLTCVKPATKDNISVTVLAEGEKGSLTFCLFPVAYSRSIARGELRDGQIVEWQDVRLLAFLRLLQMSGNRVAEGYCHNLKEGDEIDLPYTAHAWEILKAWPAGGYLDAAGENEWVDVNGEPISEPESFRREFALDAVYQVLHGGLGLSKEPEYEQLLDIFKRYHPAPICAADYDFMMDWYEVTATAARTINNHIRIGDYSPNVDKVDRFQRFLDDNIRRMEKLACMWGYAKHLWQRKEQICASRANGWKTGVEIVEVYRCGRFGEM